MAVDAGEVSLRLDEHLREHARLSDRIMRQLMLALHRRGVVRIEQVYEEARHRAGLPVSPGDDNHNRPTERAVTPDDLPIVDDVVRRYVVNHLSVSEVDDMVNLALKREQARRLADISELATVTYRTLADAVHRFCAIPRGETTLPRSEVMGIRVELTRKLISDQLEFIGVAKEQLNIRDFDDITGRIVGSDSGMGRIGGKAGGMLLAHAILKRSIEDDPRWPLAIPESYYLRSDVIEEFIDLNGLNEYRNQKYKSIEDIRNEYPLIRGIFRSSPFPVEIVQKLRAILDTIGEHPVIVRSSSLLEDRFGTAFSGKYSSIFLANQGPLEMRLKALLGAIAEVFASTLAPDPLTYRKEHNLIDYDEDMGVLIQKVIGQRVGKYYLPVFAGVAFSRNEYRWSPRIKREDGLGRLVVGLGTRAVDRVGTDHPRMIALGNPTIRPESNADEIRRNSQRQVDVINLERNRMESITLDKLLADGHPFPKLELLVSIAREGGLYAPASRLIDAPVSQLFVTFDRLVSSTGFAKRLQQILQAVEKAYKVPIDVEFAYDGEKLYVLQCRTQAEAAAVGRVEIPHDVPESNIVFTADRYVRTGRIDDVEYVVYVDPRAYNRVETRDRRHAIARVIGRLNETLAEKRFILIGPGRWGSNDIRLGVPVGYSNLNHAKMLIEVARETGGYVPEVSFGTHFFQDLVEAGIHYLPLYPDNPNVRFDEPFFEDSANALSALSPADADFEKEVRVIHVPAVRDGASLCVLLDGETDRAVAFCK